MVNPARKRVPNDPGRFSPNGTQVWVTRTLVGRFINDSQGLEMEDRKSGRPGRLLDPETSTHRRDPRGEEGRGSG